MSNRIQCFLIERTNTARESLRRFTFGDSKPCAGTLSGHSASVVIAAVVPFESEWEGDGTKQHPRDDPRWPVACERCGYVFTPEDQWQHNLDRLYRNPIDGALHRPREAPVGAMWLELWHDEPHLVVMTPGGEWDIDGPARNGGGWSRTGEPPLVTANPSILIGDRYHGWLRDGFLVEC